MMLEYKYKRQICDNDNKKVWQVNWLTILEKLWRNAWNWEEKNQHLEILESEIS